MHHANQQRSPKLLGSKPPKAREMKKVRSLSAIKHALIFAYCRGWLSAGVVAWFFKILPLGGA